MPRLYYRRLSAQQKGRLRSLEHALRLEYHNDDYDISWYQFRTIACHAFAAPAKRLYKLKEAERKRVAAGEE